MQGTMIASAPTQPVPPSGKHVGGTLLLGYLVLYAVVGADFSPGPGLSDAVAAAVRTVVRDIGADLAAQEGLSARSDQDLSAWSGGG